MKDAPETFGCGKCELSVQDNARRCELRRAHRDLDTLLIRESRSDLAHPPRQSPHREPRHCPAYRETTPTHRVFRSAQRRGDRDLPRERPAGLLLQIVYDRLGRVDRRAPADRDDEIRARVLVRPDPRPDPRDGRVLADIAERRAVRVLGAQDGFDFLDDVGLSRSHRQSGGRVRSQKSVPGGGGTYLVEETLSGDDERLGAPYRSAQLWQSGGEAAGSVIDPLESVGPGVEPLNVSRWMRIG